MAAAAAHIEADDRGAAGATHDPGVPPARLAVVGAPGTTVRVLTRGPHGDPPVLLVHGYSSDATDWDPIVGDLLDAGRRAVAVDLPGHGGSTLQHRRVDVDFLAGTLRAVLEDLDLH